MSPSSGENFWVMLKVLSLFGWYSLRLLFSVTFSLFLDYQDRWREEFSPMTDEGVLNIQHHLTDLTELNAGTEQTKL